MAARELAQAWATDGARAKVPDHLARNEQQTAILQGFGVGRPGAAVGDTELAEHAARRDDCQRQLAAVRRTDDHLDPAGDDHDQGVAWVTSGRTGSARGGRSATEMPRR